MNFFAAIMAGGSGTRFWPASRKALPKQFLSFLSLEGEGSLLFNTSRRIKPIIDEARQLIITGDTMKKLVAEHLPALPGENIIGEPVGRNTAPCLGLAALISRFRGKDAVIAALPSDHIVKDAHLLNKALVAAANRARETGAILTIGIKPGRPETGYGYIEGAGKVAQIDDIQICEAKRFVEKPNRETAQKYMDSGSFYWNAGIFVFRADRLLEEIEKNLPELYAPLREIEKSLGDPNEFEEALAEHYPRMPSISIDYGVMEKASNIEVIPLEPGWHDVGSWAALREVLLADDLGNITIGKNILIKCKDTLVINNSGKKVLTAALGLEGITVVTTPDAVFVMRTEEAQKIREVVAALKGEYEEFA